MPVSFAHKEANIPVLYMFIQSGYSELMCLSAEQSSIEYRPRAFGTESGYKCKAAPDVYNIGMLLMV
jgi:hypothetical protein